MTSSGKIIIWGDLAASPEKTMLASFLDLLLILVVIYLIWLIVNKFVK